jgi:hypothetical protein
MASLHQESAQYGAIARKAVTKKVRNQLTAPKREPESFDGIRNCFRSPHVLRLQ